MNVAYRVFYAGEDRKGLAGTLAVCGEDWELQIYEDGEWHYGEYDASPLADVHVDVYPAWEEL